MTRYQPQWLQAGSYAASVDRRLLGALWPAPASSGCAVSPAGSPPMSVNVAAGQVAVPTQNNTGSTLCSSDGVEQVGPLSAAPGAGTSRIDLIICQPRGNDLDGGSNTDFIFTFVTGTAAASPVAPATPAGAVALAQVLVPGQSASVVAGNITDVRPGGLAISGGASQPPYTGSGIGSYTDPSGEVWVAKNGVNGGVWRRARDVLHARVYRAAAYSLTTTANTPIPFDSALYDDYGMWGSPAFIAPVPGFYRCATMFNTAATAVNQWTFCRLMQNGVANSDATMQPYAQIVGQAIRSSFNVTLRCAVGDTLTVGAYASVASPVSAGAYVNHFTVDYLGSG